MVLDLVLNILNYKIIGNEVWRFLLLIFIFILYVPVSRILINTIRKYFKKFSNYTKGKIDDYIFESLNPSLRMITFAVVFYLGYSVMNLGGLQTIFEKIFRFLIILPIVFFMIKFITAMLRHYLLDKSQTIKLQETTIDLLVKIVRVTLFIIGILLVLSNLGINVSAFVAGLGIGGLAFALAAQDLLKNFFSGIALIFDGTFHKGERVNFEGHDGNIVEVNLRTTKVRTRDGAMLTIPNALLADNIVENVAKAPKLRVTITIGLTYDTDVDKLEKAKAIILEAIKEEEEVNEDQAWVYFTDFNAYSQDIKARFFTKKVSMKDNWAKRNEFRDRINFKIKKEFEKAGIEMAFPTQTIELKK